MVTRNARKRIGFGVIKVGEALLERQIDEVVNEALESAHIIAFMGPCRKQRLAHCLHPLGNRAIAREQPVQWVAREHECCSRLQGLRVHCLEHVPKERGRARFWHAHEYCAIE